MGIEASWLWNVKKSEKEAREVLRDIGNPLFVFYAGRLLAHANTPKEVFRDFLGKDDFLKKWPVIKGHMLKDSRNRERVIFWQGVYEYLIRDLKAKGIPFVRPKAKVSVDSEQQRAGQKIKSLRRLRKMTQAELAKKTGLTQQHIAKIEKGITSPRLATLKKIENALGLPDYQNKVSQERFFPSCSISEPGTTWLGPDLGK